MKLKRKIKELKRNDLLSFLSVLVLAFTVSFIPIIHWPFAWMQTFFHEISHGLTTILTGGSIQSIIINVNGSGVCTSLGGLHMVTAFMGYTGAVLWGMLIYILADTTNPKAADRIALTITALMVITGIFWAKNMTTFIILVIMVIPFLIILKTKELEAEKYFLQFTGLYVLLDAIKSPTHLLDGLRKGDGAALQDMTWVPEFIWVLIWVGFGIFALYFIFQRHMIYESQRLKKI